MRVFNVVIKFLTPTLLQVKEGYRGMIYSGVTDKVPGSTIRGSLLTWGIREGIISKDEAVKESLNPKYSVTTFLLTRETSRMYEDVMVAHALSLTFKKGLGDGTIYSLGIDRLISKYVSRSTMLAPKDILAELVNEVMKRIDTKGDELRCSANTERVMGSSLTKVNDSWRLSKDLVSYISGSYVGVGIDRLRRTSAPGIIFGYEYVEAGATYLGIVTCSEDSVMCKVMETLRRSNAVINVGKGTSRGYGLAKILSIKELSPKIVSNVKEGVYIALEVIGPTFTLKPYTSTSAPIPRPPVPGDEIIVRNKGEPLRLEVVGVFGGINVFRGWSLRTGTPKLAIKALDYGSLIIARVRGNVKLLNMLPYIGINEFSSQGFNIVLPLVTDFLPSP